MKRTKLAQKMKSNTTKLHSIKLRSGKLGRPGKQIPRKLIRDAREVYLKYGGLGHERIEAEIREMGWRMFSRNAFYTRRRRLGGTYAGWPARFGWNNELHPVQKIRLGWRNAARNEFERWLRATSPEWTWTWDYQRHLYAALAAVTAGKSKRLMIFMPPRPCKSEMVTIRYIAWRLLRDPKLNVIIGSYNQRLADKFSRRVKRVVESRELRVERKEGGELLDSSLSTLNSQLSTKHAGFRVCFYPNFPEKPSI